MAKVKSFESWLCKQQGVLPESSMKYVLEAFVPLTEANIALATRPNAFFDELERRDRTRYSRNTIKKAYYQAKQLGYIVSDETGVHLSAEAQKLIKPYRPKKLAGAKILVIFDIPETERRKRQWFRLLLRELKFKQVQKSVWESEYDCARVLSAGILERQLEKYVRVYEARSIETL